MKIARPLALGLTLVLGCGGLLAGCANQVARNYVPAAGSAMPRTPSETDPALQPVTDLNRTQHDLLAQGWQIIGTSRVEDIKPVARDQLLAQGRAVGAELVVWAQSAGKRRSSEVTLTRPAPTSPMMENYEANNPTPPRLETVRIGPTSYQEITTYVLFLCRART